MNTRKLMAKADALKKNKKNKKGFTLVELIVVLVILAILMAILIPTMSGYIKRANKTADQSACKTCYTAYSAALTDWISENAGKTSVTQTDLDTYVTNYISTTEKGKCTVTFNSGTDISIATLTYKGAHNTVLCTIGTDGSVKYSFS